MSIFLCIGRRKHGGRPQHSIYETSGGEIAQHRLSAKGSIRMATED